MWPKPLKSVFHVGNHVSFSILGWFQRWVRTQHVCFLPFAPALQWCYLIVHSSNHQRGWQYEVAYQTPVFFSTVTSHKSKIMPLQISFWLPMDWQPLHSFIQGGFENNWGKCLNCLVPFYSEWPSKPWVSPLPFLRSVPMYITLLCLLFKKHTIAHVFSASNEFLFRTRPMRTRRIFPSTPRQFTYIWFLPSHCRPYICCVRLSQICLPPQTKFILVMW